MCFCVLWLLLSGENHNGQSSQPEDSVLEHNVFSSGFGVVLGGGAWTKTLLKFQTLLFHCSLTGRAESQ